MATRSLQTGKRRLLKSPELKAIHHKPLELMADGEGSVTLGWVDDGVFYARFAGVLSAELAGRHTARLEAALDRVASLHYFCDASALRSYELVARSTFLRTVLARRSQFTSVVILTWSQGITPVARAFASAIGDPVDVLADELDFEKRLLEAAPMALRRFDPTGWPTARLQPRSRR